MDRIDQMDSIRLVLVKWSNGVLLLEHSGCEEMGVSRMSWVDQILFQGKVG